MPAVSSASVAAQSASGSTRETCLRSFFSTQASSSKSVTSPAICTGIPDASKREMRLIPLRPASRALEKAARPTPLGLTAPIPVMTQRRFISTSAIRKYQDWDSYGVFFESKVGHFSDLVDRGCCSNPQSLVTNFLVKPPLQSFFIQVPHSKAEIKAIIYLQNQGASGDDGGEPRDEDSILEEFIDLHEIDWIVVFAYFDETGMHSEAPDTVLAGYLFSKNDAKTFRQFYKEKLFPLLPINKHGKRIFHANKCCPDYGNSEYETLTRETRWHIADLVADATIQ